MSRKLAAAPVVLSLFLALTSSLRAAPEEAKKSAAEEQRAKIDAMAQETLDKVLGESPKAKELFDRAYGYAVFDNTKFSIGIGGGGGGKGVAVARDGGRRTYMRMQSYGMGIGVGAQSYQVVFLFENEAIFTSFVEKGWSAETSASAVAGSEGEAAAGSFVGGIATFQETDKGLMARAEITGTKYWKSKRLNKK